jgi:DNA-binding FadR family transcriptional regulator
MSIKLMAQVWGLRMPSWSKAVLLSLADEADDAGGLPLPSIARLCVRTCLSEREVRNAIRWLERAGALRVTDGTALKLVAMCTPALGDVLVLIDAEAVTVTQAQR